MRILPLTPDLQARVDEANTETKNVLIVPFCVKDRQGTFIEYDYVDPVCAEGRLSLEDHAKFAKSRETIGVIDSKNVIDVGEIADRENLDFTSEPIDPLEEAP